MERQIATHDAHVGDLRWAYRDAPTSGASPVLYVHGVPVCGAMWDPFLARTGGIAPDLLGFGRSDKRGDLPYTAPFLAESLDAFLVAIDAPRKLRICLHDWGAGVGLLWAMANPDRVERLVVIDGVPLTARYRWHRIARVWRTPLLGEIAMGLTIDPVFRFISRESNATKGPLPREWTQQNVLEHFDQGTQRAILRLYRNGSAETLGEWGRDLGRITAPALVLHGSKDPYIDPSHGEWTAAALGNGQFELVDDAGHWGWLDQPSIIDRVTSFLEG